MFILTQIFFIVLSAVCIALIARGYRKALLKMGKDKAEIARLVKRFLVVVGTWIVLLAILAYSGILQDFSAMPPRFPIVIVIPFIIILILTFSSGFKNVLQHVPPQNLLHIQSFRIIVEVLLWMLFIQNLLPIQMTFEDRNLDILAGILGPIFAFICFESGRYNKTLAIIYNIVGLALLVNIVTIAILSLPTPFRVFMNEPANTIVMEFPFILLPGILVPVAYSMHFFSLRQLLSK